jgi:hypothetical protein
LYIPKVEINLSTVVEDVDLTCRDTREDEEVSGPSRRTSRELMSVLSLAQLPEMPQRLPSGFEGLWADSARSE